MARIAERLTVEPAPSSSIPPGRLTGGGLRSSTDAGRYEPDRFYWHPGLGLNTMAPDGTDVRQILLARRV